MTLGPYEYVKNGYIYSKETEFLFFKKVIIDGKEYVLAKAVPESKIQKYQCLGWSEMEEFWCDHPIYI